MNFKTPEACAADRDERARKSFWGSGRKRGERQARCELCRRWCYAADRCNLFTTIRPAPQRSGEPRD